MTTARESRERPYWVQHAESASSRSGKMPTSLDGLLRWFVAAWGAEIPATLHGREVYSAEDGVIERADGSTVTDRGGSALGTRRWSGDFQSYIQSETYGAEDDDGYYTRPLHRGMWQLRKREPIMARVVFALGQSGGDWQALAERGRWPGMDKGAPDMPVPAYVAERYFRDCLINLWNATYDRPLRGLR